MGEPLRRAWEEAAEAMGATPFAHPAWVLPWWQAFGSGPLVAAVLRRDGDVVGLLPLVETGRRCRAPANTETPLFEPVAVDADAAADLARALLTRFSRRLVLGPLDPMSPVAQGLLAGATGAGWLHVRRTVLCSPYLVVAGRWEDHEARLPAGRRQNLRRRRRRLEEVLGPVVLEVSDGSEHLERDLDDGLRLEASGWKDRAGTAILARPRAARFYQRLAREAADQGWLRLAFLRSGHRRLAFDYSLEHRGVHYLLKTGFDPEFRQFGPGMMLRADMVRRAHEDGLRSYELLGNDDPWKQDWSSGVRERVSLQLIPKGATGRLVWGVEAVGRPLARYVRGATFGRRR